MRLEQSAFEKAFAPAAVATQEATAGDCLKGEAFQAESALIGSGCFPALRHE